MEEEKSYIKVAKTHKFISWLYVVVTALSVALIAFGVFPQILEFWLVFLFLAGLAALHYFTAKGAFRKSIWARVTSIVIAVVMLSGFPIGTGFGIYLLIHCFRSWK
jgi:hypothetical protein